MLDQAKLLVRPAAESDLEKILDLYAQAEFDAGRVLPLAAAKRLFERFADYPDYTLYVAEHGGDIVGTFALLVMHNLGHLGAPLAIVEDVAVAPALQLFGAGREKRIYAIPPYTAVVSLDFEDHPFERYRHDGSCALCGSAESFLDEVVIDDRGGRMFVCSDTDYCEGRRGVGEEGAP